MIDFLSGRLARKDENRAVVDVGGVGFSVQIPLTTYRDLPRAGEPVHLHTVLIVREDDMQLYGFAAEPERDLFNLLRGINGVGGKMAMDILSHLPASLIAQAVQRDEPAILCQAPGIGKKRAEKMLFELKRLSHPLLLAAVSDTGETAPAPEGEASREALEALMALGLKPADAQRALSEASKSLGAEADAGALIKEALKHR